MTDPRAADAVSSLLGLLRPPATAPADYCDPLDFFESVATGGEGDLLLDGADDAKGKGRYSAVCLDPLFTIRVENGRARLRSRTGSLEFPATPTGIIEWLENSMPEKTGRGEAGGFNGGMVYLLSYELNRFYERRPSIEPGGEYGPDLWCAFYPNARVFDSFEKKAWDITRLKAGAKRGEGYGGKYYELSDFSCDESRSDYISKVEKIKRYIESGDVYQVNLSRRLSADFCGNPLELYRGLRSANGAAYGAFLNGGGFQLLSLSPEKFFSVKKGVIETCPVKGTAPRGADAQADARLKESLTASEKDRAENVMIVDLMRNDLSKICRPFTVKVPRFLECETLPTVHQLVSTVSGELSRKPEPCLPNVLRACFPGGSVTGAPKLRAMEIIAELETSPRGWYCGSLAARGLDGSVTASILIRTLTVESGRAVYRTGGGITYGSDPEAEYEETRHKAEVLYRITRKELADVR